MSFVTDDLCNYQAVSRRYIVGGHLGSLYLETVFKTRQSLQRAKGAGSGDDDGGVRWIFLVAGHFCGK